MASTETEKRRKMLPASTAARCGAGKPGTPQGYCADLKGPPRLRFCIAVKVVQGVPSQTKRTSPLRSQPRMRLCAATLSKSCLLDQRRSHSKIAKPCMWASRRKPCEKCPEPEKSSSAQGP